MERDAHETGILRCPRGCGFEELELGRESESFMAVIGAPYMRIRCGCCGLVAKPAIGKEAAIEEWNRASIDEMQETSPKASAKIGGAE